MEEDSNIRFTGISSGLAVLLSDNKPKGSPQKSRLISYCDGIGDHSVEQTLEHIFDLPHKSVRSTSLIDINFIRSISRSQIPRFQLENAVDRHRDGLSIINCGSSTSTVVIDSSSVCGDMKTIRNPLIVESQTVFSSARANACVWKGKWMYEVTLETSGIQQLGWAIISCSFTDQKGVGDSDDSYAYDGRRVNKWNKDPVSYGQSWVVGDVIGCCIDLDNDEISFFRNGVSLGVAFDRIQKMNPENGYYPAISLSDGECCDLNFGARPFKYPISGFLPFQAPPNSRDYANYLLSCLTRLLEVQCLDKPGSAYFEKLRRLKRFAPLKELFYPISHGIMEELFDVVNSSEGSFEYFAWGAIPSFFLGIFGVQEAHDCASLDQVLELFLEFPGSDSLLQHLIRALSYGCKVAPLVLTECPYSGSYPYLALVCYILRHRAMMVLWWKSPDFEFSFEGFLSPKRPNKQDLHCLIPSVWWPGSCEDVGCESSMMLTMTALSTAIDKIEEKHRELCSLVIQFVPPAIPKELPGSVFRAFLQGFILKVRGIQNKMTTSVVSNNSVVVSLYTVILHFLSEGFKVEGLSGSLKGIGLNLESDVGFLHRAGKRRFPLELFFVGDENCAGVRRIGGGFSNHLFNSQFSEEKAKVVQWDEGGMDDDATRITHSTMKKPCCCSNSANDVETSKHGIMLTSGGFKGLCSPVPVRSTQVVAMNSSNPDAGIVDKPSTSNQSEAYSGCGSLQYSESRTSFIEHSLDVLREEELLHTKLLLYHLGVASNFRQAISSLGQLLFLPKRAFYYMSHQSQSISLLDDTDKQIREKSCIEQVKRLKEARNAYREELVDCVRQCAWYRISLFSRWKQRGMYATCMWVVELLLVLSNSDTCFCYVPEFYLESLVDTFHALRKSDPPFVASAIFLKQGLASFVCI
ncbi:hypothetical protein ZIOFF_034308 [Zingiber officinale]|uniref:B30.2/SPRY domain-containing protein n=1 Tax=Zingiber officinale TaxID=94328 RepID=A0A8J5LCT5_ZINOF|nr:hypothetical protein ZIOFF_034308 [Zingiber officinale]